MDIQGYIDDIRALYSSGQTTEHSFRPALAKLFSAIDPDLTVINEPKHITDVGAPDFVFQRGDVAIGWCEAKDIGKDVKKFAAGDYSKAQKERYKKGLPNLIYTNGLDFEFIRDGEVVDFITIADLIPTLPARPQAFALLEARLAEFASVTPLSVTSSKRLAELMAGKAALIKEIMGNALAADMKAKADDDSTTDLIGQYEALKANLISDITVADFADIYAETIAYGLFAARLHDETPGTFSRAEALELLPKSNPFLRALFVYIAGPNLDERLRRVVDDLCAVFLAADMEQVLRHFGKVTKRQDPFLHFYETFLAEYNPAKRKARGVWYTPEPVVNFIVRAVDEVLKTEFGLADGLADTSRISVEWDTGQDDPKTGKPATIKKEVHRVQILDPATGTGTFLAEAIKLIAERVQGIAPGQWSGYVEKDLIPRIHGFELLMASYAMCHMKLDMILTGLGYKPSDKPPRLGVYLTNSLEEGERVEQTLFGLSRAIAEEAKAASDIKRQTPIMCVIGNPPYSINSQNKGPWITHLLKDYKRGLREKKVNLDDDYIKFIRMGQHLIQKNKRGVLAFITNNSFLDGITHRVMRQELMLTFDKIFVLDLHGSAVRQERAPDGSSDENVFDIMQGVSILIGVANPDERNQVRHGDLWGKRDEKYERLSQLAIQDGQFQDITAEAPYYFFKSKDFSLSEEYSKFVKLTDLFIDTNSGVKSDRDALFIDPERQALRDRIRVLLSDEMPDAFVRTFNVVDSGSFKITARIKGKSFDDDCIEPYHYRPFDLNYIYYDPAIISRPAGKTSHHIRSGHNLTMLVPRQAQKGFQHTFVTEILPDVNLLASAGLFGCANSFPLYRYPRVELQKDAFTPTLVSINLEPRLYAQLREAAGINGLEGLADPAMVKSGRFRTVTGDLRPDEVKVFDYIYGVLHCPAYRETFAEFLKIDFPRVPFPPSPKVFTVISEQGEALRRLHLMEDAAIGDTPYPFEGEAPEGLDCKVEMPRFKAGKVWINGKGSEGQYFGNVPEVSWGFPIGGYQPAQKWLKDRKGRTLSWDDIRHYQRIIKILSETDRIMQEIDLPLD